MKALSVRQPWAWALLHGGKDVENRNWYTNHRGPLAIHAGLSFDINREDYRDFLEGMYGDPWQTMARNFGPAKGENDVRGAIIGVVDVVGCIPDHQCDSPWKAEGYEFFCWQIANPRPFKTPVLMKGKLSLFDVPEALLSEAFCSACKVNLHDNWPWGDGQLCQRCWESRCSETWWAAVDGEEGPNA